MELKICPDGQNKGFGQKSGKQREKERQRKTGKKGVVPQREKHRDRNETAGEDIVKEREEQTTCF